MDFFNSPALDALAEELKKEWHIPGLAVSFIQDDKLASKGYGVNTDTLFDIASCSKSFTAAAVGILVEDDRNYPDIKWDTPMSKLLPEDFVMAEEEYTKGVTLEDILSHRSGLPGHDDSYLGRSAEKPDTPASVTRNLRNLPINAPIRSKYQYCNMMYTVATHLIETHTKTKFADFLRQHIFQPLGMNSTYLHHSAARAVGLGSRLTSPHSYRKETDSYATLSWPIDPEAQGAGSICSSVDDLILYTRALINQATPFTSSLVDALTSPRIITNGITDLEPLTSFVAYALGWEISFYRGHLIVRHDGAIDGFNSVIFFLPALKIGGTILANSSSAYRSFITLINTLIDETLHIPPAERIDWRACARDAEARFEAKMPQIYADIERELWGSGTGPGQLTTPLSVYTGSYHNAGYHTLNVEIKNDMLFVDGRDRSAGFTLFFEHMAEQKVFLAHTINRDDDSELDKYEAEFVLDEHGTKAVKLGLRIEPEMEEYIWFDRVL